MWKSVPSRGIVILTLGLGLSACQTVDRTATSSIPMDDYRVRHPITLSETARTLDVFTTGNGGLDAHSAAQIVEFAELYHRLGEGPILVLYPTGPGIDHRTSIEAIRRVLATSGIEAPLRIGSYAAGNQELASPVRLSFKGLKATVATRCGEWPRDLASGSSLEGWENKPYWNYGCSYQSAFAAQVADPRDLVGPQGETTQDTPIRARAIESVRKGMDPSTSWTTKQSSIGSVGGN
jgi:pilus assembly protein CpaD